MEDFTLQTLLDFLSELSLKEIKVPEYLKIPDWPRVAGKIVIPLGNREYYYVAKSEDTGLLRIVQNNEKKQNIIFIIEEGGTFHVDLEGSRGTFSSGTKDNALLQRIRALLIFHQFKEDICEKIAEKLRADLPEHERTAKIILDALAPFRHE